MYKKLIICVGFSLAGFQSLACDLNSERVTADLSMRFNEVYKLSDISKLQWQGEGIGPSTADIPSTGMIFISEFRRRNPKTKEFDFYSLTAQVLCDSKSKDGFRIFSTKTTILNSATPSL